MFADTLKKLRNEKSITQAELAETINVSRSLVAKWEQGKALPTEDSLKAISKYFDTDINTLISNRELQNNTKRTKMNYKLLIITLIIVAIITLTTSIGMLCTFNTNLESSLENYVVESATYDYTDGRYTNIKFVSTDIEYNYESNDSIYPVFMINGNKRNFDYSTFEIKAGDIITLDITRTIYENAYQQIRAEKYHINSFDVYVTNIDLTKQLTGLYIDLSDLENEPNIYSDKNNSPTSGWDLSELSFNPSSSLYFNIGSETKEENTYNYDNRGLYATENYCTALNNVVFDLSTYIDVDKLSNVTTSPGHKINEINYWYLYSDGTYSNQIIDNYHTNPMNISNTLSFENNNISSFTSSTGQIQSKYVEKTSNNLNFSDLKFTINIINNITPIYEIIQFDENDDLLSDKYVSSIADADEFVPLENTAYSLIKEYQGEELSETTIVKANSGFDFRFSSEYGLFNSGNAKRIQF